MGAQWWVLMGTPVRAAARAAARDGAGEEDIKKEVAEDQEDFIYEDDGSGAAERAGDQTINALVRATVEPPVDDVFCDALVSIITEGERAAAASRRGLRDGPSPEEEEEEKEEEADARVELDDDDE